MNSVMRTFSATAQVGRFLWRRKRLTPALAAQAADPGSGGASG